MAENTENGPAESGEPAAGEVPAEQQTAEAQADQGQTDAEQSEASENKGSENKDQQAEPAPGEASESDPADEDESGDAEGAESSSLSIDPFDPFSIPSEVESLIVEQISAEVKERSGRKKRGGGEGSNGPDAGSDAGESGSSRRRRRRRRGEEDLELIGGEDEDPPNTVTRVRAPRGVAEGTGPENVTAVKGSTRLEAKRQRRRESREGGRRRTVITEAEFLARRESVERTMVVRERKDRIQIGVLEDGVLAEHFVSNTTQDSLIGNVYLGKVQNVLPSMEAAFIDIGRGRNAVLYAGEVNWDVVKLDGKPRRIENALKGGDSVLVQVSKDPVGHKGARLTSQISLPGRYLVYVPDGSMTGISRKLPDVERARLKKILKEHLPADAGVIVRTAAEGASEEELTNDINRLRVQWEGIKEKAGSTKTLAPELLYAEPDLTIKVVRDVFNEDFTKLVVAGENTWDQIEAYVTYVAPHLVDRLERWEGEEDVFASYRIDEQINKALDRKVFLPSGGSLVIDRTEAMTVIDVNTGKFTGSGGNLEETVTKNNLEAAEEVVRQLRLRDIGGIIVIDFIDMVLESNRDLVLRRLVECLGRDRTKHQVAEVTSLGLVQMTRKRMGTGLLEVFGEQCAECAGRGVVTHEEPVMHRRPLSSGSGKSEGGHHRSTRAERRRNRKQRMQESDQGGPSAEETQDSPKDAGSGRKDKQERGSRRDTSGEDKAAEEKSKTNRATMASIHAASVGGGRRLAPGSLAPKDGSQRGAGESAIEESAAEAVKAADRAEAAEQDARGEALEFGDEKVALPTGKGSGRGRSRRSTASLDELDDVFAGKGSSDSGQDAGQGDADDDGERKGRKPRRRGGRSRGQGRAQQDEARQGEARQGEAQATADEAASSRSGSERARANESAPKAERPARKADRPAAAQDASSSAAPAAPRRRRRVASSAQGASSVSVAEREQSASGAAFTASASAPSEKREGSAAAAPVMLGVGVSASEIARQGKE
ncbi:Rne/Rng family ribonuclease [Arthrobacter sp. UM1]|uniref:Rne/Rng family ribonuclease n=1 Tax=Arthrobacter sp. UM1 TaxID=2766776 RepID=UPI001CF683DC|nr:Rne/Rng family ribonuclease [Arthrobacter sp. UM1]